MNIADLTADEFSKDGDSFINLENITTSEHQILIEISAKEKEVLFTNVTFEKSVIIRNINLSGSIRFFNCQFKGSLEIRKCKINKHENNGFSESLSFEDCDFEDNNLTINATSEFESSVLLKKCININQLHVNNTTFHSSFMLDECLIKNSVEVYKNDFRSNFRYDRCEINGHVRHSTNTYNSLVIYNSKFQNDLFFKDISITNDISIQDSEFKDFFTVDYFDMTGENSSLNFFNSTFVKKASVIYFKEHGNEIIIGGCRKIYISNNICLNGLEIVGIDNMLNDDYITEIELNLTNKFEGLIKIEGVGVKNFHIKGENYKGNVILKDIAINEGLFIHDFFNYSSFQFINIFQNNNSTDSNFEIIQSHLEKFQFINCNLESFKNSLIYNSNISQIKSANTKWFKYNSFKKSSKKSFKKHIKKDGKIKTITISPNDYMANVKETFRQLKYAMDNQGDRFTSLEFRSYEYKAAYSNLKIKQFKHFNDWVILCFGRVNDFGLNWWKPILFWLGFNFLFYILLINNTQPILKLIDINLIEFNKIYIQLLNPLHDIEKTFNSKYLVISNSTYWIDYISRFFSSFFIFEIISAFRKYLK